MELKKSYKGFIVWMICFLVCCFGGAFLGIEDAALATRITMNVMTLSMAVLTYIIYRTGYIYWYTGITYEEAARLLNSYGLFMRTESSVTEPETQLVSAQAIPPGTQVRHGTVLQVTLVSGDSGMLGRY